MNLSRKIWHNFKTRPDVWFFYMFLATSTLSVRKVLHFFPINNSFNEYTGVYIYLSDVFLILTFIFFILYNTNSILSNTQTYLASKWTKLKMFHVEHFSKSSNKQQHFFDSREMFHVEHLLSSIKNAYENISKNVPRGTFLLIKKTYPHLVNNFLVIFPLSIAFFSFLSILWTTNSTIGIFRSIKLLEYILLYFYIIKNVPRGTFCQINNQLSKMSDKMFHVEHSDSLQIKTLQDTDPIKCSTWNILSEKINASHLPFKNVPPARNATSQTLIQNNNTDTNVPRGTFWRDFVAGGRGTFLENSLLIIIIVSFIQAVMGVFQFITQQSIGIFWLKESLISQTIPGVAKAILNGHTYIRAYGLFPHPNILGGFLSLSIIVTLLYIKMFHVEHFDKETNDVKSNNIKCSTWNILYEKMIVNVPRLSCVIVPRGTLLHWDGTFALKIILSIQTIGLFLTFSKSAIIGLLMGLFYIFYLTNSKNVPRGTFLNRKDSCENIKCSTWNILYKKYLSLTEMFHVEHFIRKVVLIIGIIILLLIIAKPDINSLFIKSLHERGLYAKISYEIFLSDPLLGVGTGQFIPHMTAQHTLPSWQYQPVHNVFLLVLNEFGAIVIIGFIYFLYKMFHVEHFIRKNDYKCSTPVQKCSTWNIPLIYLRGILLAFVFIMLFDHYFWDIQQGSLLLWILLGVIAGQHYTETFSIQ